MKTAPPGIERAVPPAYVISPGGTLPTINNEGGYTRMVSSSEI